MICLTPLFLVGAFLTAETSSHHTTNMHGAAVEVQTCETGFGGHVTAISSGLYAAGVQYGLTWPITEDWSVTFSPKLGLSYVDHAVYELPLRTHFEIGQQILVGYQEWRVALDYRHFSNGDMKEPNIGIDLVGLMLGRGF